MLSRNAGGYYIYDIIIRSGIYSKGAECLERGVDATSRVSKWSRGDDRKKERRKEDYFMDIICIARKYTTREISENVMNDYIFL